MNVKWDKGCESPITHHGGWTSTGGAINQNLLVWVKVVYHESNELNGAIDFKWKLCYTGNCAKR